jgi:hypothetical protein
MKHWHDGVDNDEEVFFTPLESTIKDDASLSVVFNSRFHLEVNGAAHCYIIKQLINHLNLYSSSRFSTPKPSKPKRGLGTCGKIIKVGDKNHPIIFPLVASSDDFGQSNHHVFPHTMDMTTNLNQYLMSTSLYLS